MKVLLVNANRMKPAIAPIGLDYLADSLAVHGHDTRLADLCFSGDIALDLDAAVREFEPEAVGISVRNTDDCYYTSQAFFLPEIRDVVAAVRRLTNAPVVLGGAGFSVAPEAALAYCGADFGIAGEGEIAFVRLLSALVEESGLASVPNLVYRDGAALARNPAGAVDLSALPARRRALPDNPLYFRKGGQAGFETKRGCAMHCIYCADPVSKERALRLMPPARVVAELEALLAQGIDHFHTCDSEFNLPSDHARDVCRAIAGAGLGERLRWYAYCAPAPFNEELASLMRRAGCAGIDFGADSGSDTVLRRLGRHFTTSDLVQTAAICRRQGIPLMYDLLVGGPGETEETVRATVDFVRRLDVDCVGVSIGIRVYPGTPLARAILAEETPAAGTNLYGSVSGNPDFLEPVFYLAAGLGTGITDLVRELVSGDPRFFLPADTSGNSNYNYNANAVLESAIEQGARGAYWDILRRMR